ncbi:MAG: isoprenoid biosynthesis glyoxalase ElbB [Nitrospiria bacterium]
MPKKIGVLLSGCGYLDGAEIREAVVSLLAIDRAGAEAVCMAPDIDQQHVIDHVSGKEMAGERNVLVESARIARGAIRDIKDVETSELDALILPGGYGAAKNLSDYAFKGKHCEVQPDVAAMMQAMMQAGKPIGVICIAPAVMAKVAQTSGICVQLTIGNDAETAAALTSMGAVHAETKVDDIIIDKEHKIVSTPAYMFEDRISKVASGIEKLVGAVIEMS